MEPVARARVRLIKERSPKVGIRNLIPNGKAEITQAGKTDKYSSRAYRPSSGVSIRSDKSYCVGAYIEVLEGEPAGIGLLSYKYSPSKWVHKPAQAAYDLRKGGKQWLTWTLPAKEGEVIDMDVLLIYAGVIGQTHGVTIRISEVILIEGDIAPTGWVPAPEDLAEEAQRKATEAEQRAKEQARIESTRILRERISIERDRAYETYRKLRTDSRTPRELGLTLEQVWITANGAYETLYRACNTAISTPSDSNISALETRTREYKAAMTSLQRSIQEVEQAIREDVYNEARGKTRVKVEGKSLDPNKYYPLIIKLAAPYKDARIYGIRIERPLYDKSLGVPPYAAHPNGYTLTLEWSVQGQGWGAQGHNRRIYSYDTKFLRDNELVISAPNQESRSCWEYVYLRGGSDVWVEVTGGTDIDIALYPEGALWEAGAYNYRWEVLESIATLGTPKIDLDTLKDSMLAEVAKARTDLQGIITRAQEASGEAFQREVQSVLASVSSLTAKLDETTGNLQKQIDKQVERWFGDSMARSGVPPTNLWDAADNAKHEGDTYTCVAPRGVTITSANAHEYPNVGKSWRWTNGGSGTAYGWVLIADTDITQALALASKAQATADGKMTHYTTATPPVSYQRGDQWTLPVAWQGRKDGRAYTYPAGSILTATADSISGQHHPEHWAELVRYTDLKIEDIKVGARNLIKGGENRRELIGRSAYSFESYLHGDIVITSTKSYCLGAYIEVLEGSPNWISAGVYRFSPNKWSHFYKEAHYDMAKGGKQWLTWSLPASAGEEIIGQRVLIYAGEPGRAQGNSIAISEVILIEGNVPPQSWTPAPEDVQAEIEAKAQELQRSIDAANRAIVKAQGAANAAKTQADNAKTAAEANDGKIDEAESRGIAKAVQAYQQSLQVEWERLKAGYDALKVSEYLKDKTALTSAYSTAKQRYDALIAKITAILSDTKVGSDEYSQYTAAYTAYQPTAKALADAIEAAGKAIQTELLKRADDAAKGRVDSIKVGGRNLARRTATDRWQMWGSGRITCTPPVIRIERGSGVSNSVFAANQSDKLMRLRSGQTYTLSYWAKGNATPNYCYIMCDGAPNQHITRTLTSNVSETEWSLIVMQIDVSERTASANGCGVMIGCLVQEDRRAWLEIKDVMLEEGNKPSTWTPAPEDIAEETERKAREIAQQEMSSVDYLKTVLRKGQASIQGGAVLGQYIAVADLEGIVRGYLSGRVGGVFLAAGVSDHGTEREARNVEITDGGDGHFGQMHFRGSGQDGRIDFIRRGETAPYLSIGGVLAAIEEVVRDARLSDTYSSSQTNMDYYPLPLQGESRELKVFDVARDGASCRISGQLGSPSIRFNGAGAGQERLVYVTTQLILQRRDTSWTDIAVVGEVFVGGYSNQDYWSEPAKMVDLTLPNLPRGQYRLMAQCKYSDNYYNLQVISQIRIMPMTILVERVSSVQQVAFTERGFRAFYGAERHVDITAQGPHVLSVRGATNIPGILAAGRVSLDAVVTTSWGAYCNRPGYNNARADKNSDNSYTVYHSIGHTDYIVQLTSEGTWDVPTYYDVRANSFRVRLRNHTKGDRNFANPFSYLCLGDNKGQS